MCESVEFRTDVEKDLLEALQASPINSRATCLLPFKVASIHNRRAHTHTHTHTHIHTHTHVHHLCTCTYAHMHTLKLLYWFGPLQLLTHNFCTVACIKGWLEPYMCTVYLVLTDPKFTACIGLARTVYMHRVSGDFPAKNIIHTPYI
jgi:hypothetical protein